MIQQEKGMAVPSRNYCLDALKALAAFCIVLHHLQQDAGVRFHGLNFYGGHLQFGYIVEFFFIVSGFLVMQSERRKAERADGPGLVESFVLRWERIWPMAAISILCYIPLCWGYRALTGSWIFGQKQGLWSAVASLLLVYSGWASPSIHGMNNPTWYLCVLIVCYALFYLGMWLADRLRTKTWPVFLFLTLLGIGARDFHLALPFLMESSARGYASFFLGTLLAQALPYMRLWKKFLPPCVLMVCGSGACLVADVLIDNQWALVTFVLYPALIVVASESKRLNHLLAHPFVSLCGRASYEVYLWHTPLEVAAALALALLGTPYHATRLSMLLSALAIEAFGIAMYQLVERRVAASVKRAHVQVKAAYSAL